MTSPTTEPQKTTLLRKIWRTFLATLVTGFILLTTWKVYRYCTKKGYVLDNIEVSRKLEEEGFNEESIRTILKQQIEEYIAHIDLMQQTKYSIRDEIFSGEQETANLSINTKFASISYPALIKGIGDGLGGNKQTKLNVSITADELGYQCYLHCKGKPVWNFKALKADYLEPDYAFRAVMLKLATRILEQSDPGMVAEYYCNTNQRGEGLRFAAELVEHPDYMKKEYFTNMVHAFYQRLDFFPLIRRDIENWVSKRPKNVVPYRLLLFDAIEKDSSLSVIEKGNQALKNINPDDPYLLTHSGMHYYKQKNYDSALYYYSISAKEDNRKNYSPEHSLFILRKAAWSAYALKQFALADSFFYKHTTLSPFGMDADIFYDTSIQYLFKGIESQPSSLGNFMRSLWAKNKKESFTYLMKADSVAKNNLLIKLELAMEYAGQRKFTACDSLFALILKKEPSNHVVISEQAVSYEWRKDYLSEYLCAKRALDCHRYSFRAYGSLIYAALNLEKLEQAADYCYEVLNYDPDNWYANEMLGDLFYRKNLAARSIMQYRLALSACGPNPELRSRIQNKLDFTYNYLQSLGKDDPETRQLKQLLSSVLNWTGQMKNIAMQEIKESDPAYIKRTNDLQTSENAATESFNKGRNEEAIGFSKQALAINPRSLQANLIYGSARIRLGQSGLAMNNFVIALQELEKGSSVNTIIDRLDNTLSVLMEIKQKLFSAKPDPNLDQIITMLEKAREKHKNERLK